jgi:hypothetical protein
MDLSEYDTRSNFSPQSKWKEDAVIWGFILALNLAKFHELDFAFSAWKQSLSENAILLTTGASEWAKEKTRNVIETWIKAWTRTSQETFPNGIERAWQLLNHLRSTGRTSTQEETQTVQRLASTRGPRISIPIEFVES